MRTLDMRNAEDYIVNSTREVFSGLICGGMELSGALLPSPPPPPPLV